MINDVRLDFHVLYDVDLVTGEERWTRTGEVVEPDLRRPWRGSDVRGFRETWRRRGTTWWSYEWVYLDENPDSDPADASDFRW